MNARNTLRGSAAALAAGVVLVGGALPLSPASADTAPSIASVVTMDGPGGGLSGLYSTYCTEVVTFTDDTPSASSEYTASIADGIGTPRTYGGAVAGAGDSFSISVPCGAFSDGHSYSATVTESGGTPSAPVQFAYQYVGHPTSANVTDQKVGGVEGFTPGRRETISFVGPDWDPGTTFSSQIWISKTPTFDGADYTANVNGTDAIVGAYHRASPVLSFTVPTTAQGEFAWITILGHQDGKADYRICFSAVPIHPLPGMPRSWVTFGKASGTPRIGSQVTVAAPRFSRTGSRHHLARHFQWFTNDKVQAIDGATRRRYTPGGFVSGRDLEVRVTVTDARHAPRVKWYRFGRVR